MFQLFENLKPSKVVILTSLASCEYHTNAPENLKSDFVKVLRTDSWQDNILHKECSFLETPNVMSGVAASGKIVNIWTVQAGKWPPNRKINDPHILGQMVPGSELILTQEVWDVVDSMKCLWMDKYSLHYLR